jgi:hypothetical protein
MTNAAEIQFSNSPFSSDNVNLKTVFKAGEYIYGRVNLDKKLIEYTQTKKNDRIGSISIYIEGIDAFVISFSVNKLLRSIEHQNNYLDFDVFPEKSNAKDNYGSIGLYFTIFNQSILANLEQIANKKLEFKVSIIGYADYGWEQFTISSNLTIDYTEATYETLNTLYEYGREAGNYGEENFNKNTAILNNEFAMKLPLPIVFSQANGKGYTEYSDAQVINMIKSRFQITEIIKLCFWPSDEDTDFKVYKENDLIAGQWGTKYFYFIFKDPLDGFCKATGGVLVKPYLGDGKYDHPYIYPMSPIIDADKQNYPYDYTRYKLGFESVFFVDCEKLK